MIRAFRRLITPVAKPNIDGLNIISRLSMTYNTLSLALPIYSYSEGIQKKPVRPSFPLRSFRYTSMHATPNFASLGILTMSVARLLSPAIFRAGTSY